MDRTNAIQNGRKASVPAPLNPVFSFNWGGDKEFVMEPKAKLGAMAIGRKELGNTEGYALKEPQPVRPRQEVTCRVEAGGVT